MRTPTVITSGSILFIAAATVAAGMLGPDPFTDEFGLEYSSGFVPHGGNLYWSLTPGTFRRYEGDDDGEFVELEITVLNRTRVVEWEVDDGQLMQARCRVIEEREWIDGELVEISRNYYARNVGTGDIYYFGEHVDIYEDGEVVGHDGSWLAGVDGAEPGLIMPSVFTLDAKYYQEIAPGVALDRAEHLENDLEIETPAGEFEDCVFIVETTPLEPGSESVKIYAPDIGLLVDNAVELVEYN